MTHTTAQVTFCRNIISRVKDFKNKNKKNCLHSRNHKISIYRRDAAISMMTIFSIENEIKEEETEDAACHQILRRDII